MSGRWSFALRAELELGASVSLHVDEDLHTSRVLGSLVAGF